MGAGGGGGSDGGGGGARAPTPRLSTFLRTFGTSASRKARSGVDVDHETHARLALLRVGGASGTAGRDSKAGGSVSGSGSLRTSRGGVSARHRPKISKTDVSRAGTRELARLVCVEGEDPSMPPRDVREALDAFVQSVVAVTGGDTFLPDQLGDAASAAFEAVGEDALARDDEYRRLIAEAAYARDPDLASRKADAFKRLTIEKEMEALRDAMGPIDTGAFGLFRERAVALAALARRKSGEGTKEKKTKENDEGELKPETEDRKPEPIRATVSPDDANAGVREYGADVAFVAPGTRHAANAAEARGAETRILANESRRRDRVSAFGDSAASAMRASLAKPPPRKPSARLRSPALAPPKKKSTRRWKRTTRRDRLRRHRAAVGLKARCLEISGVENWNSPRKPSRRLALLRRRQVGRRRRRRALRLLRRRRGKLIMGAIERRGATQKRCAAASPPAAAPASARRRRRRPQRRVAAARAPSASVTITSALDKKLEKLKKKEARSVGRRLARGEGEPLLEWLESVGLPFGALCEGDWERAEETEKKERAATEDEIFAALRGLGAGGSGGRKILPPGTTRTTHKGYEEVRVPAAAPARAGAAARARRRAPRLGAPAFAGVSHLNRIQSRIYEAAYRGVENLLVCAPTGGQNQHRDDDRAAGSVAPRGRGHGRLGRGLGGFRDATSRP